VPVVRGEAPVILVVCALAAARLTRLVVDDVIFDQPRAWLVTRLDGKLEKLITCPWCISAWLSAGVLVLAWAVHPIEVPVLAWLAVWWGACAGYFALEAIAARQDDTMKIELDDDTWTVDGDDDPA
jgi:hypothetical protein